MAHPPVVHSAVAKLARSDIAGVNVHTIPIALERAERDQILFDRLSERETVIALLERTGYPESAKELYLFLNVGYALNSASIIADEIIRGDLGPVTEALIEYDRNKLREQMGGLEG